MEANPTSAAQGVKWRDLKVRFAAALVLIPIAVADAWLGGAWFEALIAAVGLLMAWEWCALVHGGSRSQLALHGLAVLAAAFAPVNVSLSVAFLCILAAWLGSGLALLREGRFGRIWKWVGVPYVALPVLSLALLRADPGFGLLAVLWLFLVVWSADIGAYFAGRILGGPKLWPAVSPSKTWAGLAGAVGAGAVAGAIAGQAGGVPSLAAVAWLGAAMGLVEQAGDLFESAAKRSFGAKDSGTLIPGHGGILDRVDGLAFAVVVSVLIGVLRAGPEHAGQGLLAW